MGSNYRGSEPIDRLPVADMTVHHGEKGTKAPTDNCFIAFSYYNYPLESLATAYNTYESLKKEEGSLKPLQETNEIIKTYEGNKEFILRQYDFKVDRDDALSGYEVGYIELASGHVRVEGVCNTADTLALTVPILGSVTLNER